MNKIASFIITLLILCSGNVFACSCIENGSVEEEVKRSDVVFVGTVISKKIIGGIEAEYWFKVETIYKGITTVKKVKIVTGAGGGDCGYSFTNGEKYIVYGYRETNAIYTNICTRTMHYDADEANEIERCVKKGNP